MSDTQESDLVRRTNCHSADQAILAAFVAKGKSEAKRKGVPYQFRAMTKTERADMRAAVDAAIAILAPAETLSRYEAALREAEKALMKSYLAIRYIEQPMVCKEVNAALSTIRAALEKKD